MKQFALMADWRSRAIHGAGPHTGSRGTDAINGAALLRQIVAAATRDQRGKTMADHDNQERDREEDLMASGPVSRGASNKTAPMNDPRQEASSNKRRKTKPGQTHDYDKMTQEESSGPMQGTGMANDQKLATPGGGTLPGGGQGSGTARGGRGTSNSTVSGGSSSAGTVVGAGASRDRGSMTIPDMDMTTNTENELDKNSRPGKSKRKVRGQAEPPLTPNE